MGNVATSPFLWGLLLLALWPPFAVPPSLTRPCRVPQGLAPRGQGQDELRLCWAGMSKGP